MFTGLGLFANRVRSKAAHPTAGGIKQGSLKTSKAHFSEAKTSKAKTCI
ncbi:hypothetical protein [Kingella sp. (in: b-proteobacteria)]|nr:hypothetical protein [Kingella sp. (in: b-proteobacteria)]MDO4658501.1 hypothetical protein [Kingella sp. (in: b-proteobacteria)]